MCRSKDNEEYEWSFLTPLEIFYDTSFKFYFLKYPNKFYKIQTHIF